MAKKDFSKNELRHWVLNTDVSTIADEMDHMEPEQQNYAFNLLPPEKALRVFALIEPINQAQMIEAIEKKKAAVLLEKMEPDDRARLIENLDEEAQHRFLRLLSSKERQATSLLLKYEPETAGRIMSPFFIALNETMTAAQALEKVRTEGEDAETIYVLPIVDDKLQLQGLVELDELVLTDPNQMVQTIMHRHVKRFSVQDDQEEVARYIQSSDWLAVPIIEADGHLVGMVTIDDAMDVMLLEETEDIFRGSASGPLGKPYLSVPVWRLMQVRVIWLSLLALAGTLTVNVISAFETTLHQVVVLALFIPLLIGIGGNTGSQSATTVVRALAVSDIRTRDFFKVALRETCVGLLLGVCLGLAGFGIVWLIFQPEIALVIALSLFSICTMAALTGSLMPILASVLNLDPAVVSAPFVSTIIDATGLFIYFMIAKSVLGL